MLGLSTNRSASVGHVKVPILGYKKDAFLEPSLDSNKPTTTPSTPTTYQYSTHPLIVQLSEMSSHSSNSNSSFSSAASHHSQPSTGATVLPRPGGGDMAGPSERSTLASGGRMTSMHVFQTTRGDRISSPPGRRPNFGRNGGAYPQPAQVG